MCKKLSFGHGKAQHARTIEMQIQTLYTKRYNDRVASNTDFVHFILHPASGTKLSNTPER